MPLRKKLRIAVLMGGPSAEREISLVTGRAVANNLNKKKYEVLPLQISQNGKFFLDLELYRSLNSGKRGKILSTKKQTLVDLQNRPTEFGKLDLIFIALHGTYGEDGAIQGMLECLNIPYTGSGILASALGMDKEKAAEVYRSRGIPTPDFIVFGRQAWEKEHQIICDEIKEKIGFPAVIKPTNQGSAVGVSIVKDKLALISNLNSTFKTFPRLMVQKYIRGKEATCGVLEKKDGAFALPPTRIIANVGEFYDYNSKYAPGGSTHVCPADFSQEINKNIQKLALAAHQALGCRGMSRTDIFVEETGKLWVIETNTIPGMTPTSLFPEAAAKAGISFSKMLDMIIESSSQLKEI